MSGVPIVFTFPAMVCDDHVDMYFLDADLVREGVLQTWTIVAKCPPTPAAITGFRRALGFSRALWADRLRLPIATITGWESGDEPIPDAIWNGLHAAVLDLVESEPRPRRDDVHARRG